MATFETLVEELGAALAAPDLPRLRRNEPGADKKWLAGDIGKQLPSSRLEEAAQHVGISLGLLRSYVDVARAYPPESRTIKAAWTIYREVRILPPEQRQMVLRDGLTLRAARIAIGKGPMDRPKRENEPIDKRVQAVIEELADPEVQALVMEEMASSGARRKARKAARSTVDEIAAERKFIEAELRKQKQKPTPDHQFLLAKKELTEAARLVYSVAQLYDRHRDYMAQERWEDIVKTLRDVTSASQDVADQIEGIQAGDFIDGDAVDEFLALGAGVLEIEDAEIIGESS